LPDPAAQAQDRAQEKDKDKDKARVTVYPFDDRKADGDRGAGSRVADLLASKLAANPNLVVVDRQFVDKGQGLQYERNYDSAAASKNILPGLVDLVITGKVDKYDEDESASLKRVGTDEIRVVNGSVSIKATVGLISTDKRSTVASFHADSDQEGILCEKKIEPGITGECLSQRDLAIRKLTDQALDAVARQLYDQIASFVAPSAHLGFGSIVAESLASSSLNAGRAQGPVHAAFLGVSEGQGYINTGSAAGVKVGDKFVVRRVADSGLREAVAGRPLATRQYVCTLVVTSVEENMASGKCTPEARTAGPGVSPDSPNVNGNTGTVAGSTRSSGQDTRSGGSSDLRGDNDPARERPGKEHRGGELGAAQYERAVREAYQRAILEAKSQIPVPSDAELLDQSFAALKRGNFAYSAPEKMKSGRVAHVTARIGSEKVSLRALVSGLPTDQGAKTGTEVTPVSAKMKVILKGADFEITPLSSEEQIVAGDMPTQWEWDVVPKHSGKLRLHLAAIVELNNVSRDFTTVDREITVQVDPIEMAETFTEKNLVWILGTLGTLIAGGWAWWKRRKKAQFASWEVP